MIEFIASNVEAFTIVATLIVVAVSYSVYVLIKGDSK